MGRGFSIEGWVCLWYIVFMPMLVVMLMLIEMLIYISDWARHMSAVVGGRKASSRERRGRHHALACLRGILT